MKEYSILAITSVLAVVMLNLFLKTKVMRRREFWVFIFVIFCFKLAVNGLLTGKNIVMYNPRFFMGFRIGSIPVEDFLFGFSMVSLAVIVWEGLKRGNR